MQKSEQIDKLALALIRFQSQVPTIEKTKKANYGKYADLAEIVDKTKRTLVESGLAVTQVVSGRSLVTALVHTSGQFITGEYPIEPDRLGPQAFGSALTYARRYAMSAILGVVADDDDDGQTAQRGQASVAPIQGGQPQQTDTFADVPGGYTAKIGDDRPPSDAQIKRFYAIAKQHGWYEADYRREIKRAFSKENERQLNRDQYNVMCDLMQRQTPGPVMNTDDAFGS